MRTLCLGSRAQNAEKCLHKVIHRRLARATEKGGSHRTRRPGLIEMH
jgi:hypothetical protein